MANIKVKFKEAYQDFGAYALLKNVTDKGVLIVDGTEVLNSIADLPTTNTVDGQEKAVIVQNGQVVTTSISNIGGESGGDFIPLSGTEVGKPVTGDIEFLDGGKISVIDDKISLYSGSGAAYIKVDNTGFYVSDGVGIGFTNIGTNTFKFNSSEPYAIGFSSDQDFSPNITDLDYTQKIYVDTKVAKIGADDIEITDFNKGIILTSPNSSRYRITVDNSGNLITTLIP